MNGQIHQRVREYLVRPSASSTEFSRDCYHLDLKTNDKTSKWRRSRSTSHFSASARAKVVYGHVYVILYIKNVGLLLVRLSALRWWQGCYMLRVCPGMMLHNNSTQPLDSVVTLVPMPRLYPIKFGMNALCTLLPHQTPPHFLIHRPIVSAVLELYLHVDVLLCSGRGMLLCFVLP